MADNALAIEVRENTGKGVARKLRAAGRIPGVFYGKKLSATPITLDPHVLERALKKSDAGMNTLFDVQIQGGGELQGKVVLVKDLQRDPVTGSFLHADLYAVDLEQALQVSVPLHVTGKAPGVEMGGILDQALREIELSCLPTAIPREIQVDVSGLNLGDSIHIRDLGLPEGVDLVSDPDLSVVSVVAPRATEEEAAAEEAAEGEAPAAEAAEAAEPAAEKAPAAEEPKGD